MPQEIDIPKEITEAYKEYLDKYNIYKEKYISWLKNNKGIVFTLKAQESFHTCNPFEGTSSITFFNGYCKILNEENERPIVRLMHMDSVHRKDYIDNNLTSFRYFVNVRNFTGYTYESLIDIIDKPVADEELIPFVKDIMSEEYETDNYFIDIEDIKNNNKPWEHKR